MPTRPIKLDLIDSPKASVDRFALDPDDLRELCDSIASLGLINPVTVRKVGERFVLIAGRRRFEAHRLLGLSAIPATLAEFDHPQDSAVRLAENLVRSDLSPVEEARAVDQLACEANQTPDQLAATLRRSPNWIRHRLALANYPPEILEALHCRLISLSVADELSQVVDPDQRANLLAAASENGCTGKQASMWRAHANAALCGSTPASTQERPPDVLGPPPVVTKACFSCSVAHPLTSMTYICLCSECTALIGNALRRPAGALAASDSPDPEVNP